MNDGLWAMKVVVEKARNFSCVMNTKFLCLGNLHLPTQPTSRFQSAYQEYVSCCQVQYQTEALIAPYFGTIAL